MHFTKYLIYALPLILLYQCTQVDLHDGHNSISIEWSGKGSSDTIVILGAQSGRSSTLHISHDYGVRFTTVILNVSDYQAAQVNYFIKGPVTNQLVSYAICI